MKRVNDSVLLAILARLCTMELPNIDTIVTWILEQFPVNLTQLVPVRAFERVRAHAGSQLQLIGGHVN
jgi:hypothetical protein